MDSLPANYLKERGYWIREDVFSFEESESLIECILRESSFRSRAGIRNLMSHSAVREFANDLRLIELTRSLTGRPLIPFKATLFEKTDSAMPHCTAVGAMPARKLSSLFERG